MADNDFIAPNIYSSDSIQKFVNSRFFNAETVSDMQLAESYWEEELGGFDSRTSPAFQQFVEAISALPDNVKKVGVLSQLDLRPLLLAQKEYLEGSNPLLPPGASKTQYLRGVDQTLEAVDKKYREDAKEFVGMKGEYNDKETEAAIDNFLNNSSGFSPTKNIADDLNNPNSSAGGNITADGKFVPNNIALNADNQIDYTQYLQEYATSTVNDLLNLEEKLGVTEQNVFTPGAFLTNLTGKITTVKADDPNAKQTTWSLSEGVRYIYGLDTAKVTKLQKSLRDSGYFDKLGKFPAYGQPDEATALAWNLFLSDALRNNQSPSERLKNASDDFAKRMASGQGNLFLDEASVESAVLAVGSQVLGRGLDKTELESLTALVRNWEREAYKTTATGTGPTGEMFSEPDIEARINRYMQETYREETVINSMPENIKLLKQAFG
jgi:hypothetical protein